MSLNKKIIDIHEKHCLEPITKGEIVGKYAIYLSFLSIITSIFLNFTKSINDNELANIFVVNLISLIVILFSIIIICNNPALKLSPIEFFLHQLHYILPKKLERNLEIEAYKDIQKPLFSLSTVGFLNHEIFKVKDIHPWLIQHVSEVKSILSLCHKRSMYKDGTLNMDFLYWTQLIPSITNVDVLKQVLLSSKVSGTVHIEDLPYISRDHITKAFSLYSEADLLLLFTSPLSISDYAEALELALKEGLSFPIETNMKDLYISVKEMSRIAKGSSYIFKNGSLKEGQYEELVLKQVKNVRELSEVALYMRNCLKFKEELCIKNKTEIYTLSKNLKPFIVFEYKKKVIEAKKRFNESLTKDELILLGKIVKESLNGK